MDTFPTLYVHYIDELQPQLNRVYDARCNIIPNINVYHIFHFKTLSFQMRDWPLAFPLSFQRQLYLIHGHMSVEPCFFSRLSSRTQSSRFYAESRAKLSAHGSMCSERISHTSLCVSAQAPRRSQIIQSAHQETAAAETKRRIFPRKESNYHQVRALSPPELRSAPANAERAVDFRTAHFIPLSLHGVAFLFYMRLLRFVVVRAWIFLFASQMKFSFSLEARASQR